MAPPTSKKRRLAPTIKAKEHPDTIEFNPQERHEYLTGFHKRKLARAKHAQELAKQKERKELIELRKEIRQQRRDDLQKHVEEVNAITRRLNPDISDYETGDESGPEEWNGFEEPPPPINREEEYVDEDKYTTVTIEDVDITRDGFSTPGQTQSKEKDDEGSTVEGEGDDAGKATEDVVVGPRYDENGKRIWTKENPNKGHPKKKKKKFRYESKAERKVTRMKETSRNRTQARARKGDE
ncbi:hypothetical protein K402DRAFT_462658 [Aulographum hederae CBS 113979]|uniref:Nucleolar protein 12 n=1 Tax=Aulographum hederae CBS 113979 TaxID=1176131 RepID=A0A6G1H3K7_9PEZI|nr:hypothetical protein K402DRAFT_462658 [Aulographum hederae CBS 113979]